MKHLQHVSKSLPVAAAIDGHPDLWTSISNFLKDPIGTIRLHLG